LGADPDEKKNGENMSLNGCKKNTVLKKLNSLICNFIKKMRAQSDERKINNKKETDSWGKKGEEKDKI